MSVSTHHPGDGSNIAQDDFDHFSWLDLGQVDWEDLESFWQAWLASDLAHHRHELRVGWHGDDRIEADGVDEARDGADHERQWRPEDDNDPAAAPDPAGNEHHQQASADEVQHDESEANNADGVDQARDGSDHEHQ